MLGLEARITMPLGMDLELLAGRQAHHQLNYIHYYVHWCFDCTYVYARVPDYLELEL